MLVSGEKLKVVTICADSVHVNDFHQLRRLSHTEINVIEKSFGSHGNSAAHYPSQQRGRRLTDEQLARSLNPSLLTPGHLYFSMKA